MTLAPVDALLRERRGSFRLRIPLRMNVYGEARDLDGQDQTLELYDLSRDGLSAEVREVQHWQPAAAARHRRRAGRGRGGDPLAAPAGGRHPGGSALS
jgi:hypothetical protein